MADERRSTVGVKEIGPEEEQLVRPYRKRADHDSSEAGKADDCSCDQRHNHRAVFNIVTRLERVVPVIENL